MSGSQCRRLVQEEQLGEPARAQQFPAAALEHQLAGDPPPNLPCADQLSVLVLEDAPVPEQESPRASVAMMFPNGVTRLRRGTVPHGTSCQRQWPPGPTFV